MSGRLASIGRSAERTVETRALDDNGPFIALDSAERIAAEPAPRLVAADVPRTSLAALGLPLTPENAGDSVRAEMLVAADGAPLALRLSAIQ